MPTIRQFGFLRGPEDQLWQPALQVPEKCLLLLDASYGVTVSGGFVTSWTDQSGNSNTATQPTGGIQPTLVSTINGQPAVRFNGSQGLILPNFFPGAGLAKSFAIVYKLTALPGSGAFFNLLTLLNASGSNETFIYLGNNGGYLPFVFGDDFSALTTSTGFNVALDTNAHAIVQTYNGGTNSSPASYTASLDGTAENMTASGALSHTATVSSIGARFISGVIGIGAQADIAAIYCFSSALSAASQATLGAYFLARWGV